MNLQLENLKEVNVRLKSWNKIKTNHFLLKNQVLIIYALTKGYLDDIPVEDITRFEDELNSWTKSNGSDLLNEIRETGGLPSDDKFEATINEFKKSFSKSE